VPDLDSHDPRYIVLQMVEPGDVDNVHIIAVADNPASAVEFVREAFIELNNNVVRNAGGPAADVELPLGVHIHVEAEDPVTPGEVAALDQAWEDATSALWRQVLDADWATPVIFRRSDLTGTTYVIQRLDPPDISTVSLTVRSGDRPLATYRSRRRKAGRSFHPSSQTEFTFSDVR
jgi:hypothetical protein